MSTTTHNRRPKPATLRLWILTTYRNGGQYTLAQILCSLKRTAEEALLSMYNEGVVYESGGVDLPSTQSMKPGIVRQLLPPRKKGTPHVE